MHRFAHGSAPAAGLAALFGCRSRLSGLLASACPLGGFAELAYPSYLVLLPPHHLRSDFDGEQFVDVILVACFHLQNHNHHRRPVPLVHGCAPAVGYPIPLHCKPQGRLRLPKIISTKNPAVLCVSSDILSYIAATFIFLQRPFLIADLLVNTLLCLPPTEGASHRGYGCVAVAAAATAPTEEEPKQEEEKNGQRKQKQEVKTAAPVARPLPPAAAAGVSSILAPHFSFDECD
mmetsp:Transcript_44280/g.95032  ORF Transcript_44280/g.95032 Transcript_44280/m.95032 type:complete len:233 (-) Transcript_44280:65-763(-)